MKIETFDSSLLAKGWMPHPSQPHAFTKTSAGLGGDIGFVLEEDGIISQQQEIVDSDGNHVRWQTIMSCHIDDLEDDLSPNGLWVLKAGKSWSKTGKSILL